MFCMQLDGAVERLSARVLPVSSAGGFGLSILTQTDGGRLSFPHHQGHPTLSECYLRHTAH